MAVKHAVLSASSSERWINCPPSARLCEAYEDKGSDYAAEGTDAHSLCEFRLKQALGIPADDPIENLSWYNEEMEDCAAGYAAYVSELLETAKQTCADPLILIEQRVDFSRWVQDGFGTADCIVIADGVLNIVDYKHGKGVEVSAVDNPQMMLYALGALEIFDGIYDIDSVRMTIYQPRKSNISVCIMEKDGLLEWAQNDLTYKAKLAYEGGGDFHCGEWCRFCKAKAECRERAEANLALARYDFEEPPLLTDEEIAGILDKVDALTAWAADVKEYALQQAAPTANTPAKPLWPQPLRAPASTPTKRNSSASPPCRSCWANPALRSFSHPTLKSRKAGRRSCGRVINGRNGIPQKMILWRKCNMSNNTNRVNNPMKVITGPDTRWSYANVWEPKSINGGTPKYSVSLIIPKSDTKTVAKIKAAIEAAYQEGQAKLKGNGRSVPPLSAIKTPLRDGDVERPDDPAYANAYFINANSATAPGIVDADRNPVLTRSEVYSGVYGRASINLYAFNSNGNKGIACGLNNLQLIRPGEPLGGKASAEADFATDDDEDFLG